jgi:hypothetical protein
MDMLKNILVSNTPLSPHNFGGYDSYSSSSWIWWSLNFYLEQDKTCSSSY